MMYICTVIYVLFCQQSPHEWLPLYPAYVVRIMYKHTDIHIFAQWGNSHTKWPENHYQIEWAALTCIAKAIDSETIPLVSWRHSLEVAVVYTWERIINMHHFTAIISVLHVPIPNSCLLLNLRSLQCTLHQSLMAQYINCALAQVTPGPICCVTYHAIDSYV